MESSRFKHPFRKGRDNAILAASLAIFFAAASLRLVSIFNDPWLDEIWSWYLSRSVSTPVEIISKLTLDNNHPLNTFYLWVLGDQAAWEWYRLLSLVSGISSVALMGMIGRRYGRLESVAALALGGFSYFLIHYSSEARGYAPVVLFALLSFYLAPEIESGSGRLYRWLFCAAVLLGLLSHPTYLFAYAGIFAWKALRLLRQETRPIHFAARMMRTHGVPLVLVSAEIFWLASVKVGGGPEYSTAAVIVRTALLAFGLPENRWLAIPAVLAAALLLHWGTGSLRREKREEWVFFPTAILLAPACVLIAAKPAVLFQRYFLVCAPFFLLLLARWFGWLSRKGTAGKVLAASLLFACCSCNLFLYGDLVRHGRGGYSAAMRSIAHRTERSVISIGSDHDFRNGMLVDFYSSRLPLGKNVVYVAGTGNRPEAAPEWFVVHRIPSEGVPAPPGRFLLPNGAGYVLDGVFPSSDLSGFWWYLYRKSEVPF